MKIYNILLLLLFSLFLSCSTENEASEPIRIGLNIWPGYGAFFIAEEKGYFEENGVKVDLKIIQGDQEREASLISGKLDGIGMTMDNLVLLRDRGIKVKAIYKYDGSYGADGIVVANKIDSIHNLRGKQIAFAPGTTSHFFLTQVLKMADISQAEITNVVMSSDEAGAAFAAGNLEAAVTWEPWLSKAVEMENGKILISTKELPVIEDVLFVSENAINDKKDEISKFLRACFRAVEYWKNNQAECNQIIAKKLELPVADIESMLSGIQIMDLEDNKDFFQTKEGNNKAIQAYKNAYDAWSESGLINNPMEVIAVDSTFISGLD